MKVKINEEIKSAMKARDKFRLNALKLIKSKLEHTKLPDVDAIIAHHKTLAKSQEFFVGEQLTTLEKELDIIKEFMPKMLSKEEYEVIVDKHMDKGNMGAIIKAVRAEVEGSFDGGLVSSLIKEKLS
jgi:uncharacterized protein YqeY